MISKIKKLRATLTQMLITAQTDLSLLLDAVYEIEQCQTDSETHRILDRYQVLESETK
jgi:hypothetical protein